MIKALPTSCTVHFEGNTETYQFSKSSDLLTLLRSKKIPVPFSCGGEGICTTCRIIILDGEVSKPEKIETERLKERNFKPEERLSCQCHPVSDHLEIAVP